MGRNSNRIAYLYLGSYPTHIPKQWKNYAKNVMHDFSHLKIAFGHIYGQVISNGQMLYDARSRCNVIGIGMYLPTLNDLLVY